LRASNVHHGQRPAAGAHAARHGHVTQLQTVLQLQAATAENLARRRIEKDRAGCKQRHAVCAAGWHGHQRWRNRRHGQRIDADDSQLLAPGLVAVGIERIGRDFQHRTGHAHLRAAGDALVKAFVKTALYRAQLQIRLAVDGAYRLRKFAQGRGIDEMHRKRQRHAEHHRHHGGGIAPGMVAEFLPGEGTKESTHPSYCEAGCISCSESLSNTVGA